MAWNHDRTGGTPFDRARHAAGLVAAAVVLALGGCDAKTEAFFNFLEATARDETPPLFFNPLPSCANPIISTDNFMIEVADANDGAPSSGLDLDSFRAFQIGGGALPHQATLVNGGAMITIDVGGIPDGNAKVGVTGRDRVGNESTFTWDKNLDRTPPIVEFLDGPGASIETAEAVLAIQILLLVQELNLETATLLTRLAGPDGMCGTADDTPLPANVLADGTRTFPEPGEHEIRIDLMNPVEPGADPLILPVCWIASAVDRAVSKEGVPGINTTTRIRETMVTLIGPPPTTGGVEGFVTVGGEGVPEVEVTVAGRPPVRTDANGFYRITGLEPGEKDVRLTDVPADVHCPETTKKTTIVIGENQSVDFQCQEPGEIAGTVLLDGEPLQNTTVEIFGPGNFTTQTDSDGEFFAGPLAPGEYEIVVQDDRCPRVKVRVRSGETTEVTIQCTTPVDFNLTVEGGYNHIGPGSSEVCGKISTDPARAGATFQVQVTGPGVVGDGKVTGTLDNGGMRTFAVGINQVGTYTITTMVTSGGTTKTTTTTVNVEAAQGTCPAAVSSMRFKRDVRRLVPDGFPLLGLRPVLFRYRAGYGDPTATRLGLIAEEVHVVYPEAVALDDEGRPAGIHYRALGRLVVREAERHIESAIESAIERMARPW